MGKESSKDNCLNLKVPYLTDNSGAPVPNDSDSLTVGRNGPTLLQDLYLLEKISSFDRERIPERVVHAKGASAQGYFQLTSCMKEYTMARIFNETGVKTPVTVRFSTVIGSRGSADTMRDPRGFATKFYTKEGNLDIVGNHIPIFFIRDSKKFPDLIHAFKPSPDNNLQDKNRFWDFVGSNPESTNMITFVFSDLGTIASYRYIEGFGVNTYEWINREGRRSLIKYHWIPKCGVRTVNRFEAERLAGVNPDVAVKDLYDAIEKGDYPEYTLKVQVMDPCDADNLDFNPLDATKVWPEDLFPLIEVGKMILNKNPHNFFTEVEQLAFCPANLVPGIELSADKLLQARGFSYRDTQRHRIGTNFHQLPINRPLSGVNNNTQDGPMRYSNKCGKVNYKDNYLDDNKPEIKEKLVNSPKLLKGKMVMAPIDKDDDFKQAGERFCAMTMKEKKTLVDNIVADMWCVDLEIQLRAIRNFSKASREWGEAVRKGLNINANVMMININD